MRFLPVFLVMLIVLTFTSRPTRVEPIIVQMECPSPVVTQAQIQATMVLMAMSVLAESENTPLDNLVDDPRTLAETIVRVADENQVKPFLLLSIAWAETRLRADLRGDCGRPGHFHICGKNERGARSCGITQVRFDFLARHLTCAQLLDPAVALAWTAKFLHDYPLEAYNGKKYAVARIRQVTRLSRVVGSSS